MVGPSRKIGLASKLGLLLLSLAASALAAEALWRWAQSRGHGPPTVYDPVLGWRFKPGTLTRHSSEDFDVEIRIDRHGRRVAAGEPAEDVGRPAIVFLGDSLTFGWGVEAQRSFPSLLGRMLGVEVVNLGVAGYGTDQAYLLLRRQHLAPATAAVVLTFCHNDLEEVVAERMYGRSKPRFRFDGSRLVLSAAGERATWLERASSLYRTFSLLQGRSRAVLEGARRSEARRLVRHLIGSMAAESQRLGARFLVAHAGEPWLGQALDEDGVPRVEVGEALRRAAEQEGPVIFASDRLHWTPLGHRVVAQRLRTPLEAALAP